MNLQNFESVFNLIKQNKSSRIFYASTFISNAFGAIEVDLPSQIIIIDSITLKNGEEIRDLDEFQNLDLEDVYSINYEVSGYADDSVRNYFYVDNEISHGRFFEEEYEAYDYYFDETEKSLNYVSDYKEKLQEQLNLLNFIQESILSRRSVNYEKWQYNDN